LVHFLLEECFTKQDSLVVAQTTNDHGL